MRLIYWLDRHGDADVLIGVYLAMMLVIWS